MKPASRFIEITEALRAAGLSNFHHWLGSLVPRHSCLVYTKFEEIKSLVEHAKPGDGQCCPELMLKEGYAPRHPRERGLITPEPCSGWVGEGANSACGDFGY